MLLVELLGEVHAPALAGAPAGRRGGGGEEAGGDAGVGADGVANAATGKGEDTGGKECRSQAGEATTGEDADATEGEIAGGEEEAESEVEDGPTENGVLRGACEDKGGGMVQGGGGGKGEREVDQSVHLPCLQCWRAATSLLPLFLFAKSSHGRHGTTRTVTTIG